jgi:2',3'-cyclic-nucleotide 2'-phosphodiesterase (5'-nucleotidase family)
MKSIKLFFVFFFALLLASCSKDDGKISFTILQINDVYEIAPIQNGQYGGMARVETVHQELLAKDKNTMLILAGDFLNPSLIGTMKQNGKKISGQQMVDVMNTMKVDLAAFGNHEFDVKEHELEARLNESTFPWISSNVFHVVQNDTLSFTQELNGKEEKVRGSFIKEISDKDGTTIKIGIISTCIDSNPKNFVYYADAKESIVEEYNRIKDSVDVVIGMTHVTIAEDREIAKLLPELPLIMGGHEHTHIYEEIGNVPIRKADANAKSAYIHTINFDKNKQETTVESTLKYIDTTVAFNPDVQAVVKKWQDIMDKEISKVVDDPYCVIYNTEVPLIGKDTPIRSVQTNLGEIVATSMSHSYDGKVDCTFINGGAIRIDDDLIGDINSVDIFRVLPYGGKTMKVTMTGKLLKRVLEFGENAAGSGAYLQRYDVEKEGGLWKVKGKAINDTQIYKVAMIDYLLLGLDIPFLTKDAKGIVNIYVPKEDEMPFDVRKGTIDYLKKQSEQLNQELPNCN